MIDIDELRRLAQAATPGPWHATKSVETNSWAVWSDTTRLMELRPTKTVDMYQVSNTAAFIAAANPAAITELLDRLEAAEKERDALRTLVVMRCDLDYLPQFTQGHESHEFTEPVTAEHCRWFVAEIERLRAKIEAMEKQEPVAVVDYKRGSCVRFVEYLGWQKIKDGAKLYALPGAQPTLRVPPDAIDAINRARETAMKHTLVARIPECGVFAEIAQDLDYVQSKLVPEDKP